MSSMLPHLLVADLHGRLLRRLSAHSQVHFQGLHQAARHYRQKRVLDHSILRKLMHLDIAYNLMRHITEIRMQTFLSDIEVAPATARPDDLHAPRHFYIASDVESIGSAASDLFADDLSALVSLSSACAQTVLDATNTVVPEDIDTQVSAAFSNACSTYAAALQSRLAELESLTFDADTSSCCDRIFVPPVHDNDFDDSLQASCGLIAVADTINASCRLRMARLFVCWNTFASDVRTRGLIDVYDVSHIRSSLIPALGDLVALRSLAGGSWLVPRALLVVRLATLVSPGSRDWLSQLSEVSSALTDLGYPADIEHVHAFGFVIARYLADFSVG
mmetsp:Transcript_109809/g.309616  ORF Transcript_109809/g.309616 Transcript_109809/m.309616 type:complete len:333 (+) Transcript_109809:64-1062(+)